MARYREFKKILKKKNEIKPWETLIVSENLTWDEFSKINFYLHELSGARPVLTVGRNYPYNDTYTHVLGYVSEASVEDLVRNETIKERNVPGLRVGKTGLEKALENELIGTNGVQLVSLGYVDVTDDVIENAFGKFKILADKKKHIYDEDIAAIVDDSLVTEDNVTLFNNVSIIFLNSEGTV